MKPCPSCGWMLKDTDPVCNMCGASVGGGGAVAPPPVAAPPPVMSGGAYAPPGPPGMGGYPGAPPMRPGAVAPPPPVSSFGAPVAPPPPVHALGPQVAPPPPVGPMGGGYGAPPPPVVPSAQGQGFSAGGEAPIPLSPWARAAPAAPSVAAPSAAVPAAAGGPPPAPPTPINMIASPPTAAPQFGGGAAPQFGGGAAPQFGGGAAPQFGGGAAPQFGGGAAPQFGGAAAGAQQSPVSFGQPPPMVQPGGLGGMGALGGARPGMAPGMAGMPGMVAPPPMVSPPPLMSPGSLSGGPAPARAPDGPKVLVGFLVTFQSDPGGSFWPIHSGSVQMGRSSSDGVDIALPDASASSRHASIHADPATGQAFVEDNGSRNGTFLNEARLAAGERRQLRDNDRLRLGSTTFVVKLLVS